MYAPKKLIGHLHLYLEELIGLISKEKETGFKKALETEYSNIENYIKELKKLTPGYQLKAEHIQQGLKLEEHPEGGYYREFIRNNEYTVIFYLLPKQAVSNWHSLKDTEEKFKLISGDSLVIHKINSTGLWKSGEEVTYDNKITIEKNENGEFGDWFGAYPKGKYGLVTCECRGPFELKKFKMVDKINLIEFHEKNPKCKEIIDKLTPVPLKNMIIGSKVNSIFTRPETTSSEELNSARKICNIL